MHSDIDVTSHEFVQPTRGVFRPDDMAAWLKSKAYLDVSTLVSELNDAVKGVPLTTECLESDVTKGMVHLLEKLDQWIDETPALQQPQRFGNQAYKVWYNKVCEEADALLETALPKQFHRATVELKPYLTEGFGNSTRIDYGTGHEMCFIMLLCCLYKIGALKPEVNIAVVIKVFNRYLNLVRKLQVTYRMEPAGSHGVWSLDDFQFVPFIWGSSQLIEHERVTPSTFLKEEVVRRFSNQYMFLSCILYIISVKRGPFSEHSNLLWNISKLDTWESINSGLVKMYKAEVMGKFPVIQHVLFGSMLTLSPSSPCPANKIEMENSDKK